MTEEFDREFLEKVGMTEQEFRDFAFKGACLYKKYKDFVKNKQESFQCECGKTVAHTRKQRHLKTEYHKKRTAQA